MGLSWNFVSLFPKTGRIKVSGKKYASIWLTPENVSKRREKVSFGFYLVSTGIEV